MNTQNNQYISMFWPCLWLFLIFLYMPESNTVNVYTEQCSFSENLEKTPLDKCKKFEHIKHTYNVSFQTQTVVGKLSPTFGNKYENCIVFDRHNWRCGEGNSYIGVFDGVYREEEDGGQFTYWTSSSFIFYYYQEIKNTVSIIIGSTEY